MAALSGRLRVGVNRGRTDEGRGATERIVAYCGLVCTECPAHIATQADDRAALERAVLGGIREGL